MIGSGLEAFTTGSGKFKPVAAGEIHAAGDELRVAVGEAGAGTARNWG